MEIELNHRESCLVIRVRKEASSCVPTYGTTAETGSAWRIGHSHDKCGLWIAKWGIEEEKMGRHLRMQIVECEMWNGKI